MIYHIEYKCYTEYQCCSKVHCKLSLVADALRISLCKREIHYDIAFMRHSNQKENKYIQGSKGNKS